MYTWWQYFIGHVERLAAAYQMRLGSVQKLRSLLSRVASATSFVRASANGGVEQAAEKRYDAWEGVRVDPSEYPSVETFEEEVGEVMEEEEAVFTQAVLAAAS